MANRLKALHQVETTRGLKFPKQVPTWEGGYTCSARQRSQMEFLTARHRNWRGTVLCAEHAGHFPAP